MSATRNARLAVVFLLLTVVAACSRRHETQDFLPSAPATQNALQITNVGAISVPADGVSTVRIEAQISPDANLTRTVRFHTTLGGWQETAATAGAAAQRAGAPGAAAQTGGARQVDLPQTVDKEADTSGRAAAFLQSTTTEGVAVVSVSVIAKDSAGNVTDTFATVTRDVAFVQVSGALVLRVDPVDTFADGVSAITLEAEISADSPSSWNMVTFTTTLGKLDSLGADDDATDKETTVPTDGNRIARARLTSTTGGTASVIATIQEFPEASATEFVTFAGQNPDAITISTSAAELPADGTSQVTVTATIDVGLAPKEVTFTTTAGTFASNDMKEVTATTNASNQATVQLKSDTTVNPSVLLTATIELTDSNSQSATTTIAFIEVAGGEISVTPESWDFGEVTVDTISDRSFTIGNHGTVPLTVSAISIDAGGQGFTVPLPPLLPTVIAPAGSLGVTVRFNPTSTGSKAANLKITSDDTVRPVVNAALLGQAVVAAANIAVDPASLVFGNVGMASTKDLVLMVKNIGTADLTVSSISSNKAEFAENPAAAVPFTVVPGGQEPITIRFTPGDVGPESGVLTITSDDPDTPNTTVQMSGAGI